MPAGPHSDSTFIRTCHRQPAERRPVWFMRQAGRSLPEYRAIRGTGNILDALRRPELAAEITMQPVRRYDVDAAILFSDIVVPIAAIGFGVELRSGIGPVVDCPFRGPKDLERLRPLEPEEDLPWVQETIRLLVEQLKVPLIGFAGAPFTLASYLIEGGHSRTYAKTKTLMYSHPELWSSLMERLSGLAVASLRAQITAGVSAVQLFDSWVGALSADEYRRFVLPATRSVFSGIADLGVPGIHFGVGTGELLGLMSGAGADVVGVDWRVSLDQARRRVGEDKALQGNLDPAICLAPWPVVRDRADRVMAEAGPGPGHIFNLGHGVLPETDPDILARLADHVHRAALAPPDGPAAPAAPDGPAAPAAPDGPAAPAAPDGPASP